MKKLYFALVIGIYACALVGCSYQAQSIRVLKSNDLQSKEFEPTINVVPTIADLKVDSQKVMGYASGSYSEISGLKKEAITNALGYDEPSIDKPDVLVGTNFFYEVSGALDLLKVTVIGYPARYVNFRSATENDTAFLKFHSPTKQDDEFYSVSIPLSSSKETSRYFSVVNDFGGGFSFGGRIQPSSWLQIVSGGTVGFWTLFKYEKRNYYYYDYYYGYHDDYEYYWDNYFAWGGPFVKLLFGKDKFWGEVSDRVIFGMRNANQIMFGFTYAPSKK